MLIPIKNYEENQTLKIENAVPLYLIHQLRPDGVWYIVMITYQEPKGFKETPELKLVKVLTFIDQENYDKINSGKKN